MGFSDYVRLVMILWGCASFALILYLQAFFFLNPVHAVKKKNNYRVMLNIFLTLAVLASAFWWPTDFREGKNAFEMKNWSGAIEALSKIEESSSNYVAAKEMLVIAKTNIDNQSFEYAKSAFRDKDWSLVINNLSNISANNPNYREASKMLELAKEANEIQIKVDEQEREKERIELEKAERLAEQPIIPTVQNMMVFADCAFLSHIPTGGYCLDRFYSCLSLSLGKNGKGNFILFPTPKENGFYNRICSLDN